MKLSWLATKYFKSPIFQALRDFAAVLIPSIFKTIIWGGAELELGNNSDTVAGVDCSSSDETDLLEDCSALVWADPPNNWFASEEMLSRLIDPGAEELLKNEIVYYCDLKIFDKWLMEQAGLAKHFGFENQYQESQE